MTPTSRRGIRTLAGAITGLLLPLAAVAGNGAPAQADAADYDPITTAKVTNDGGDVATPTSDLATAGITINPNIGAVHLAARLTQPPASYVRRAVISLGTTDEAGSCQPVVEIAASNASEWSDTELVVRRPGELTFPPEEAGAAGGDIDNETYEPEPLAADLVPDCGTFRLTSKSGAVLDTADLTFTHSPVQQVALTAWSRSGLRQQERNRAYLHPLHVKANTGSGGYPRWAYDVTVTVAAPDGVQVKQSEGDYESCYGTTEPTFDGPYADLCYEVTVTRGGVHTVTFTVDAGNADPVAVKVQVYAPGGPLPAATGDLSGRYFARFEEFGIAGPYSFGDRSSIWFLDRRFAYVGAPRHGRPTCAAAQVNPARFYGCQRYWWDKARNVLQVGHWRGSVRARRIDYVDLVRVAAPYGFPVGLPPRGKRFDVTWRYLSDFDSIGQTRLRLTRDGRFELAVNRRTSRGRYAVGANGRLRLTYRSGRVQVHTFAIGKNRSGRLDPAAGALLSLPNFDWGQVVWLRKVKS